MSFLFLIFLISTKTLFKNITKKITHRLWLFLFFSLEGLTPILTQTTVLTTSQTSSESSQSYHQLIENVVNPLGTVTTVNLLAEAEDPLADNPYVKFSPEDYVIHENCDESLFRPVVVFCDNKKDDQNLDRNGEFTKPPALIENKLIVPVIDKSLHMVLTKKEAKRAEDKFEELSNINKLSKGDSSVSTHDLKVEENIKVKEEVVVIKGKKSKKKAAELGKELTPPRDVKNKAKKEDVPKNAEPEEKNVQEVSKEDKKKCVEKSVKVKEESKGINPKTIPRPLKPESTKEREDSVKINEYPEIKKELKKTDDSTKRERKSSLEKAVLKMEADNQIKQVQKTGETKYSLELDSKTIEDKKAKEVIPKPLERKNSLEQRLIVDVKAKETQKQIPKPVERKNSLEQRLILDVKAKETLNQKDIEPDIEEVVFTLQKKGKKKKEVLIEAAVKQEESDSTSSEEKSVSSVKNIRNISEKALKAKEKSPSPLEIEDIDEVKSTASDESDLKQKSAVNIKKDESLSKETTTSNDKNLLKVGSSSDDNGKQEITPEVRKKGITTDKKTNSNPLDHPEKIEQVDEKVNVTKKEKTPAKEVLAPLEDKSSGKKSKTSSRSSSPAKEVQQNKESSSGAPSAKVIEPNPITKTKSKAKKQSRESSPDVEVVPQILCMRTSSGDPLEQKLTTEITVTEAPTEDITKNPDKEPVEPTITNKKKKKNKKASRESSPETTSRKNSLKDVPTDLLVFDEKLSKKTENEIVQVEVEQTVTIKKKSKNKKVSRESSPEVPLVDDNLSMKTKSNAIPGELDKEYKVVVREVFPKEVSVQKETSPPVEEPKITDFLRFVDHFNKKADTDDNLYKVAVKDISPPEADNDFPSLSFSTKKSKKNKKPTTEMVLPIEKEPFPIVETISPFQPLDKITLTEEGATLINFESPTKINLLDFERPKGFPEDIIFAICGNLSEPNENPIDSDKEFLTSSSTASASDETTDDTVDTSEKKKKIKKLVTPCNVNDDEELRPLISTTAETIEATPTPEVLYPCKYSEKDVKSSDSSSDTGGGSYAIPEATVVPAQPEQQATNQQHQNSKKKIKRRKR